jgi:hypothetical protein
MKKFNDYNINDLSFDELKINLEYEFGIMHRDDDLIFDDEGFKYWYEQLKEFDILDNLIYMYQDYSNQVYNILMSLYPKVFYTEIIEMICNVSSITRIEGCINGYKFEVTNSKQTKKDIVISFYIQSKLLLLLLEYFQFYICRNISLKEVYGVLNRNISKMKFSGGAVYFRERYSFEIQEKRNSPTSKMKKFVLEYLVSIREEIYNESIVKIHSSTLSKTTIGKEDYWIDEISLATTNKPAHFLFNENYYSKIKILKDYVNNHSYFTANNTKGLITKNPKGFNIACAILCRQMTTKGWLKENIGGRELMKFINDEFNLITRAHHQFASSKEMLEEKYPLEWKTFNNMPTPN